jgi:hypothetical protein
VDVERHPSSAQARASAREVLAQPELPEREAGEGDARAARIAGVRPASHAA